MPNFSANIIFLFNEFDLRDRVHAASNVGFQAVECQQPYEVPAPELTDILNDAGVEMILINTPPSTIDPAIGGVAIFPNRVAEFRELVEGAITYAAAINCPRLHVVAGRMADDMSQEAATETFIKNICWAADLGANHGVRILIEPLNGTDNPGYFLTTAAQGRDILSVAAHANLFLQFDLYHAGVNAEDVIAGARAYLDVIDHMQMAGVPGRHEPNTGEIDMMSAFAAIDEMGYTGWIGAEYRPATTTLDGLGWAAAYGITVPPRD